MLKRKYGSRYDWKRILERSYVERYIVSPEFEGYVTLFRMHTVSAPLLKTYEGKSVCIADEGFSWMQHFPTGKRYSVTTVFNGDNEIVQWYIDICSENGYCETNGPWMDDMFLDLIVLPTGEVIEKDADELEEALQNGHITKEEYMQSWEDFRLLKNKIVENELDLANLTQKHFQELNG